MWIVCQQYAWASANLPWSTTYNCAEWVQGQSLSCDGLSKAGDWTTSKGSREQITSEANYPGGAGGKGQRHWIGGGNGGVNDLSGGTVIWFNSGQRDVWIRWYMRFQQGFRWSSYAGFKVLYFQEDGKVNNNYFQMAFTGGRVDYYTQYGDHQHYYPADGFGWTTLFPNGVSDGSWHCYEVHIKSESGSGQSNGVFQAWVDGKLVINASNVDHGLASRGKSLTGFLIGSNAKYYPTGDPDRYVDYDDFMVTSSTPSNQDAQGNRMIGPLNAGDVPPQPSKPAANFTASSRTGNAPLTVAFTDSSTGNPASWAWDFDNNGTIDSTVQNPSFRYNSPGTYSVKLTVSNDGGIDTLTRSNYVTVSEQSSSAELFSETFDSSNFSSRGWYDNTNLVLSTSERVSGSAASVQFKFPRGATQPTSGGGIRKTFQESDSVYMSYYVKYSSNWVGSNKSYHPHMFYFMTNKNGAYDGLAYTKLTVYVEQNGGYPQIGIQDGDNIDESRVGQDLVNSTESRSVAGCNGDSDGYGNGSCYLGGTNQHWNWKQWRAPVKYFSDSAGPYYKADWHFIEAYVKLNSISGGEAVNDGIIQYWYDGELIMDYRDVVLRTGQHPDMRFNQFVIAPWIGDGSPVEQSVWVDNLSVGTTRPGGTTPAPDTQRPDKPTGLQVRLLDSDA